ncbi:exonuclease SbcCD subunit D [Clostridium cellulovorans]|uniref:Nuclease SbcCD subunit D n=1 Tax=Clostridium cellulovorans (strain ATCC 35296 / DSM 3052 / OCM 3 / 743B) TaxID=573061 RepID=D9SRM4_CLOC7|nr:exonuclease SbcCD subunit D [Clostridium cellulovorans]ADL50391.1 nuclease SbcCD, D subunit [Clostridium cellulovorans 743B]
MKFLHLGDLHIGKIINNFSMIEDQKYILDKILEVLIERKPDALVLAGDIYDRSFPPTEAVMVLNNFLSKVVLEHNISVMAVAGNHDSGDRLHFGSDILSNSGLYIEGVFNREVKKIRLMDEHGPVNFYLLPFADSPVIREALADKEIKNLNQGMEAVLKKIYETMDGEERNVLITHGFVRGKEPLLESESERPLSIGGTDYVDIESFNRFNYTALGHLHGPQRVDREGKIRYSGSLLKYSFSEENHKKSIAMVELDKDGNTQVELIEVKPRRDMRTIKGELTKLLDPRVYKAVNTEDYLRVVLIDEGELIEPMAKLREVYPNVMVLERERIRGEELVITECGKNPREKSKLELFEDFYAFHTSNPLSEEKRNLIAKIIEDVEKESI